MAEQLAAKRSARATADRAPALGPRSPKSEKTRQRLVAAAVKVVGKHGYAEASVARITRRARVAQGTFYLYFKSRQELLDLLLPTLGDTMIAHIRERVGNCKGAAECERVRLRAYFEFLNDYPEIYRILHEAPKPVRDRHMKRIETDYLRALQASLARGEMPGFAEPELLPLVYVLLGIRDYLTYHHLVSTGGTGPIPDWMLQTVDKVLSGGLFASHEVAGRQVPAAEDGAVRPRLAR